MRRSPRLVSRSLALAWLAGVLVSGCDDRALRPAGAAAGAPTGAAWVRSTAAPDARRRADGTASPADELSGKVVRVRDGDSIVVLVGRTPVEVRLDGVDAPELAQAFGKRAKRRTADLALGKPVRLEPRGKDKYSRTLAVVILPDGRSLNRELVSSGFAWWFRRHSTDGDLESSEREARASRLGLWSDPAPVAPWEFRALHLARGGPRGAQRP